MTDALDDTEATRVDGDDHGRRQFDVEAGDGSDPVVGGRSGRRRRQHENVVASVRRNQSWTASIDIMRWIVEIGN
jgi:hypothetical protein